jgi:hypothetical protein
MIGHGMTAFLHPAYIASSVNAHMPRPPVRKPQVVLVGFFVPFFFPPPSLCYAIQSSAATEAFPMDKHPSQRSSYGRSDCECKMVTEVRNDQLWPHVALIHIAPRVPQWQAKAL